MTQSQDIIEELSPVLKKFLGKIVQSAIGKEVDVRTEGEEVIITGESEAVMKARQMMSKVKGLVLDRMEDTPDGKVVVFTQRESEQG